MGTTKEQTKQLKLNLCDLMTPLLCSRSEKVESVSFKKYFVLERWLSHLFKILIPGAGEKAQW